MENGKENSSIIYIFTYLITWLSGIIVFVTEGQTNKRMKFHSLQAIFLGIIAIILFFIPFVGLIISAIIWIYGMYIAVEAYEGKDIKVPVIADYASKYSGYS